MLRQSCVCIPSTSQRPTTCRYCSSLRVRCNPLQLPSRQTHHTCACTAQPAHHTAHAAAHEQHTHGVRTISMHALSFPSTAGRTPICSPAPCILSSVADLSCGWHAHGPLVCAPIPLVSRSIPPLPVLPSSVDECAPLLPREFPRGTE